MTYCILYHFIPFYTSITFLREYLRKPPVAGKWGGADLPTLLLWSVPLLYAASAAVFVYAGEVEGGSHQIKPGADRV